MKIIPLLNKPKKVNHQDLLYLFPLYASNPPTIPAKPVSKVIAAIKNPTKTESARLLSPLMSIGPMNPSPGSRVTTICE